MLSSYSATDIELLALYYSACQFKDIIGQNHFYALTDHKPLEQIFMSSAEFATRRLGTLYWKLQSFIFTVVYVKPDTSELLLVDILSEQPGKSWQQSEPLIIPICLGEKVVSENSMLCERLPQNLCPMSPKVHTYNGKNVEWE